MISNLSVKRDWLTAGFPPPQAITLLESVAGTGHGVRSSADPVRSEGNARAGGAAPPGGAGEGRRAGAARPGLGAERTQPEFSESLTRARGLAGRPETDPPSAVGSRNWRVPTHARGSALNAAPFGHVPDARAREGNKELSEIAGNRPARARGSAPLK